MLGFENTWFKLLLITKRFSQNCISFSMKKINLLDLLPCQQMHCIPPEQRTTKLWADFHCHGKQMKISKVALLVCFMHIQYQLHNHPTLKKINIPLAFGDASLTANTVIGKGINIIKIQVLLYLWERIQIAPPNHLFWKSLSDKAFDGKVSPNRV